MTAPSLFSHLAIGLGAGLVGAAAMFVSQKIEMRATGREPSDTPAEAVEAITGIATADDRRKGELSTAAHFAFGTALGLGLTMLDRLPAGVRAPLFGVGAWAAGAGLLVALDLADPPTEWGAGQLATDLAHHAVYAAAASSAYAAGRDMLPA